MSAYAVLRLVHGYWRWMVLVSACVVLVRVIIGVVSKREWTRTDDRAIKMFSSAFDLQFLIGVVLYFGFSPFFTATYQSFRETMSGTVSRFFGIEHQVAMVLAMTVAHIGRGGAARAPDSARKHRTMLIAMLIVFALMLWAIPWPWREVGRPLFRTEG
jgi:hypothetical protein